MLISIYPAICGEHRELRADANLTASGPFDSPPTIAGRLVLAPHLGDLPELQAAEVLYEGEVYRFQPLDADGSFQLHKAW